MSTSSVVTTAEQFLALLESSELLPHEQLDRLREEDASGSRDALSAARHLVRRGLLTRWQAAQLLAGTPMLRVGKYRLCDQLGRGELGRVFLAEHISLGRKVALKTLSRRYTENPQVVGRFLKEARAAAALDHRNIIHVYDIDTDGDRFFLVTEFVEGRDVERMVEQEGPLAFATVADIVRQAAEGLDYLHQSGMVHRDMRPANLLVDSQDIVKILGVGVGQLADARRHLPEQPPTLAAMSVEPATTADDPPDSDDQSRRHDWKGLGACMFFMLTGQLPEAGAGVDSGRVDGMEIAIQTLRPEVPPALATICARMLNGTAGPGSPSDAPQVSTVLEDWLAANQTLAGKHPPTIVTSRPDSWREDRSLDSGTAHEAPARPRWRRALQLVLAACAGAALVLLAIAISGWLPRSRPVDTSAGRDRITVLPRPPDKELPADRSGKKAPTSPLDVAEKPKVGPAGSQGPTAEPPKAVIASATEPARVDPKTSPAPPNVTPPAPSTAAPAAVAPSAGTAPAANGRPPTAKPGGAERPNPLADMPPFADLPPPEEAHTESWQSLCALKLEAADDCTIQLLGGDAAIKGVERVELTEAADAKPASSWEMYIRGSKDAESDGAPVARLRLAESGLEFQWTDAASRQSAAGDLINCVLKVSVGPHSARLALRTPIVVPPAVVNLEKLTPVRWYAPHLPDPEQLRIQVTSVDGVQKYVVQGDNPIPARDGKLRIALAEKPADARLFLSVETSSSRFVQLQLRPYYRIQPEQEPRRLTVKEFNQSRNLATGKQISLNAGLQKLKDLQANLRNESDKQISQAAIAKGEKDLDAGAKILAIFDEVSKLGNDLNGKAAVQMRVYFMADDAQVDIFQTKKQ